MVSTCKEIATGVETASPPVVYTRDISESGKPKLALATA
jgi:hypothetical protein